MKQFLGSHGTLVMIGAGMFFYTLVVLVVMWVWPGKEQPFALFSGILGGFAGSFFTAIKTGTKDPKE